MKVAIVNRHPQDALGGSEIQCDIIANALAERGNDVVYIAVDGSSEYAGLQYKVRTATDASNAIIEACLVERPSVVYWRFNKNHLRQVVKAMDARKIPLVFAVSHLNDLQPWRIKLASQQDILHRLQIVLAGRWNFTGYRWVKGLVCQTPEQMKMAPVPRSTVIFNSGRHTRACPFPWPLPYVAWISNIKTAKRPELCLSLATQLWKRGIDVVMVGRIVEHSYGWLADASARPQNLHYIGPRSVEEVAGVLAGAQALVHTCLPEGFPNVFIQSWLQGTPTVSLEFDPANLIRDHGLGLVSGGIEQQFHEDVLKIASTPELARQVGDRAKIFAKEHLSPERNAARLEAFLLEVIEAERC